MVFTPDRAHDRNPSRDHFGVFKIGIQLLSATLIAGPAPVDKPQKTMARPTR